MSEREHSGLWRWWKSRMPVGKRTGLRRASQVLPERFYRQQS